MIGTHGSPLQIQRAHPRWSEQAPEDWWQATGDGLAALRAAHPAEYAQIAGVGFSGQMHGAVLLDADDQVLRPAILWNDMRSDEECGELTRRAPRLQALAGNLAMPGFTAPKLLWVARHEPQRFRRIDCVLLPKDYLRLRATGQRITDPSDAAGTLWLDVAARDWSDELLAACGLSRAQMPRLCEGSVPSGRLLPHVAAQWSLAEGVAIATGGGDNAASAIGVGATESGDGFVSLGTSGVLSVIDDRFRADPQAGVHAFCHAIPQRWQRLSVVLSAAACLRWVCQLLSTDEITLLQEVAELGPAHRAGAPLFLPYLAGERTPHNDPYAQGVFFGLNFDTGRAAIGYAVIEGVSLALADGYHALGGRDSGLSGLSLLGGGARSSLWAQLLADALNLPIRTHGGGETGAALGAARLGWLAAGGDAASVLAKPGIGREYRPDTMRHAMLGDRLQRYRELYRHLRPLFEPTRERLI